MRRRRLGARRGRPAGKPGRPGLDHGARVAHHRRRAGDGRAAPTRGSGRGRAGFFHGSSLTRPCWTNTLVAAHRRHAGEDARAAAAFPCRWRWRRHMAASRRAAPPTRPSPGRPSATQPPSPLPCPAPAPAWPPRGRSSRSPSAVTRTRSPLVRRRPLTARRPAAPAGARRDRAGPGRSARRREARRGWWRRTGRPDRLARPAARHVPRAHGPGAGSPRPARDRRDSPAPPGGNEVRDGSSRSIHAPTARAPGAAPAGEPPEPGTRR